MTFSHFPFFQTFCLNFLCCGLPWCISLVISTWLEYNYVYIGLFLFGICLMKKETYKKKIDDILNLSQFEKWVKPRANSKDLIVKEEERINNDLMKLQRDGQITEELRLELKSQGGQPPRIYGLAKVHKVSVPVRPVLSIPGSPYYNIASKVMKCLSVVPKSKCQSSSKKIADQLKDIYLEEGEVLGSFDVVSLYTNVPVQEAITEAADRFYCGNFEIPPVSKETFIKLLQMAWLLDLHRHHC